MGRCSVRAKVTRVTASAPHCISLPFSGSKASRTAPARGTKMMTVRMVWSMFIGPFGGAKTTCFVKQVGPSLVQPDRTAEDHNEQDGCGPEGEPAGVGANVA